MTRLLFVSFTMLMFSSAFGQFEPRLDSMPDQRNTFGVNITPAIVVFMNSYQNNPRFSAAYKRQMDVNRKIRFTLNYEIRENFEEDLLDGQVINYSDTTITYLINYGNHTSFDARLGMEWFKPNRKVTSVYGVDLMFGALTEQDGYRIIPRYFNGEFEVPSPFVAQSRYEQTITYAIVGFDFSIGQRIRFSEKTNMTIRWTPEFFYRIPIQETYSDITQRTEAPDGGVEMRLRGIELYFNYHF
jgi:hypothetical protein